jgi:hypothetical protein
VVFHIDHPSDKNRGYYRIGRILDANGIAAGGWSKQIEVPSEIAKDNQGTDIALTDLDRNGSPDLIVFHIGHKKDTNYGFYQIGKNFDEKGIAPGNWSEPIQVPGSLGRQNQGAGIAVTDLNRSGYPDFIIFYIDSSKKGENRGYYRIGRDLNADGIINSGWSEPIPVPGSFGTGNHCASITVADLDGNGRLDLIVFYIDPQEEKSLGYYRIGKHIDVNGIVTAGWSEPILVLDPFNSQNHGASIAIADLNRNGRPDLIVFHIEHPPKGENRGYYRVGKNLDAKGFATGGWSKPILVPGWFGTRNQGAGIVFTMLV